MKILVADDSKPIRDRLLDRLSRLSTVDVYEAVDTPGALQQIEELSPDVAVLDIRMPGGGGIKVLQAIRQQHPDIVVMIMTNYPYAQYRRKCLDAGADFFFDKSTEFELVAETVRELLDAASPSDVARKTAINQLVAAKEKMERIEQRRSDLSLLGLFKRNDNAEVNDAHLMWEKTFDAIPDMIALFDAGHRIIRVNKAMADRLDMPAVEMTGKHCYKYVHGTDCPVEGCPHAAMLKDGKEHGVEIFEERLGGYFFITVSPIFENGKLIGAIHIARDVTVRKRAEQSLKENEERYRGLFESMQSGFALHEIICDEAGKPCDYRFLEVNSAFEKMVGLSEKELIGHTVKEVLPLTESHWIDTYGRVALTGEPAHIEEFASSLGRHYSVRAYSPSSGQFATVVNDVTEQVRAAEELRQARDVAEESNRAKTQFLANMSHELRTPLNAIIGLSELLADSSLDEEQSDYVKTISDSGEALLTLISDLLDLSKIELGKLKLDNQLFNIRTEINRIISVLLITAEQKGLELSVSIDENVPEQVSGDIDRLKQVLINLINNAVKFTHEGFVRLSVENIPVPSGTHRIQFTVEDSGVGMDAAVQERIFEPFQQADSSTTRQFGGSGLGLAISRDLVHMMGGDICVKSRKGHGSCFRFHIADKIIEEEVPVDEELLRKCRGRRICLWDDDPENLHTLEYLLDRCGISVLFSTGVDAIPQCVLDDPPDVVLNNLDMSGMRKNLSQIIAKKGNVPWIAMSNWMQPLDDELRREFSGFIDRPVNATQLYEILGKLFS